MTYLVLIKQLKSSIFLKIQAERTNSMFHKNCEGDMFLYLFHIFETAAPK